jgi:hypothetical protein
MKHAKFFSILVFIIVVLYGITGFYLLPLASFQGDLTRVGMLPESLFGWTKTQPAINPELLRQSSMQDADVLVIGDSFSDTRIWQTVLTGHGLRVHTEHWSNLQDTICADFSSWLHAQGFKGKYVVVEAIERRAKDLIANSVACNKLSFHNNVDENLPHSPPVTSFDHSRRDLSMRLSVGYTTAANMFNYKQLSSQADFNRWTSGSVRVSRVPQGCELFSHLSCADALFYELDSDEDLGEDVIKNMEILNARFIGVTPIWVVVPDKSTAYLLPEKHFWDKLEHRLSSVNLLKPIRQAIKDKTIDVYPANNSHLSTSGYLLMGEAIYRKLNYKILSPTKP